MQQPSQWTKEREDLLRELNGQGSDTWLAREINARTRSQLSRNAIISKRHRLGIELKEWRTAAELARRGTSRPKTFVGWGMALRKRQRQVNFGFYGTGEVKPPTRIVEVPEPAEFLGLSFMELQPKSCRFPRGESPVLFCGQPQRKNSSYCAYCHTLVYYKPSRRQPEKRERISRFAMSAA